MNANLRGDVRVKGVKIEEFIKAIVDQKSTVPDVQSATCKVDVESIVKEKLQPLDAFQDEKRILSENMTKLTENVAKLTDKLTKLDEDQARMSSMMDEIKNTLDKEIKNLSDQLTEFRQEFD